MSIINRMLKDLDTSSAKVTMAPVYNPPSRRLPGWYWCLLLLLPLSLWLWWQPLQQRLHPSPKTPPRMVSRATSPETIKPASPAVATTPVTKPVATASVAAVAPETGVAVQKATTSEAVPVVPSQPRRSPAPATDMASVSSERPLKATPLPPAPAEVQPVPESPVPEPSALRETQTEDGAVNNDAEPQGEMRVEEQKLSPGEIANLERRKYQQALARRDSVAAQQALLQVLANDPLDLTSRKQLAALYYGESQLTAAHEILKQGIALMSTNADLRLLAAKVVNAMGDKAMALQYLLAISPSAANNLDFYALRAALAEQLGQMSEAGNSYQMLLRAQPAVGRWWLGLAITQEQRGLRAEARQSYRRALLDTQLSAASRHFAQQRISSQQEN